MFEVLVGYFFIVIMDLSVTVLGAEVWQFYLLLQVMIMEVVISTHQILVVLLNRERY
jgi:hypothetical protein